MEKQRIDLGPAVDLVKNIGVIAGSLGSVAVLFYWIGNAIIIARLRAYNLFGIVHYTDEYVKEAGYQFLHDIFSFFNRPELILFFIIASVMVVALIPVGPVPLKQNSSSKTEGKTSYNPYAFFQGIRENGFHYIILLFQRVRKSGFHYVFFLLIALSASVILTGNWSVRELSKDIIRHDRILAGAAETMKTSSLDFKSKMTTNADEFHQRFYQRLFLYEKPSESWLKNSLVELNVAGTNGSNNAHGECVFERDKNDPFNLKAMTKKFQCDFDIKESPDFSFDGDFGRSNTYRTLLNIRLNAKLNSYLRSHVESTLKDIRQLLSAHLNSEEDFSSLVVIPANYSIINESIHKLRLLRSNILTFFEPGNPEALLVMKSLNKIRPIQFGSILLTFSFWILLGLLLYLLLNIPSVLRFRQWELGYFFLMLFLFLTIAVALPSAYGKYKFEFKIQKLNNIIFTNDSSENTAMNPIKKSLQNLWDNDAKLYILGPTKGREVIVGALKNRDYLSNEIPQIIMLDRSTYSYINVEPVKVEEIPEIIRILRQHQIRPNNIYGGLL